tara:strand:+ start:81 stop:290 length:210 start_codon:yes stop_codon:yes gene_type:complete
MFKVQHKDDAWELGVLNVCGLVDHKEMIPSIGEQPELWQAYENGQDDAADLSDDALEAFAAQYAAMWCV